MDKKLKIIFAGTPEFALPSLQKIVKHFTLAEILVITQVDKPVGRKQIIAPPPVKVLAERLGLTVWQPKSLKNKIWFDNIKMFNPTVLIVVAYGKIIPDNILNIPRLGGVNVHPSLLPKHRGPAPIQAAILNLDNETGVSIMLLDAEMDHGPILAQEKIKLNKTETGESLHNKLSALGADLLIKTLDKYLNHEITAKEQNHAQATYTKLIQKEDGKIDWQEKAEVIEAKIRAFSPWPGAFTRFADQRLKLSDVSLNKRRLIDNYQPGQVFFNNQDKTLQIAGGDQKSLIIHSLQLEGKKNLAANEFLRGYPRIVGSILK